jgi:putative nucleotidyltransferase with HDIG domain
MNLNIDSQRTAELWAIKIRWVLIAAAALFMIPTLTSPLAIGALLAFAASNVAAHRLCSSIERYEQQGRRLMATLRAVDGLSVTLYGFFGPVRGDTTWLLAIPVLLSEALVTRSVRRTMMLAAALSCLAVASYVVSGVSATPVILACAAFGATGVLSIVLSVYKAREEVLSTHDRRLQAVLECSTALADSTDLRSMILQTLKSSVQELGGTCGYVMLTDEENKGTLMTEAAYSVDGNFEFPDKLPIGTGLSGYAVKMGQPIAIHNNEDEVLTDEGTGITVRSALSVPLVSRTYQGVGQASVEQVLGALTIFSDTTRGAFEQEDMELLRSLGSLMAVAVANARMEERQRSTFLKTLESLAKSLEARDTYTRGHSQRVCEVSLMIGERLGFGAEALEELRVGTILHDIGKIGVPDAILNKPGRLTDEEFATMKSHPVVGYEICRPLMLSEGVLMIIRNHHEKLDGSGYPDGLKGGELPLSLRIVCVADAFDAMSSSRPYRSVMDINHVLAELSKGAGVQFDPVVVEALKELLPTQRMLDCYHDQWHMPEQKAA